MSSYQTLAFYGRAASFSVVSAPFHSGIGYLVVYRSTDTGNVSLRHSVWAVPGTLDVTNN